jgi:hypothetical protein
MFTSLRSPCSVPNRNHVLKILSLNSQYLFIFFTSTDSRCVKFVSSEISGCHTVVYLLIFALQKHFRENIELCSWSAIHSYFPIFISNGSLVIDTKLQFKYRVLAPAMLLYILQENKPQKVACLRKISYHTTFQYPKLSVASVAVSKGFILLLYIYIYMLLLLRY